MKISISIHLGKKNKNAETLVSNLWVFMKLYAILPFLCLLPSLVIAEGPLLTRDKDGKETARLLVNIPEGAQFSPEEFSDAADATLIWIDPRNPFIAVAPEFMRNPFIAISPSLDERTLRNLALRYGYRYIKFTDETLHIAKEKALSLIKTNPKFSSEIQKLTLEESIPVYTLMEKIDRVFSSRNINYWAGGGTLLGVIRHGGLIPWDDDLDLYILDTDEKKLQDMKEDFDKEGLVLHYYWKDLYKIFEKDAARIADESHPGEFLPFAYPAADIFVMTLEKRKETEEFYVHRSFDFYWHWNTDRFTYLQIENISRAQFGPLMINIPGDPEAYINRLYGILEYPDLWKKYAFEPTWDHKREKRCPCPGSALVEIDDFSPAPWQ